MITGSGNEGSGKAFLGRVTQLNRLVDSLNLDPTSPLYSRAKRIVEGMIDIWQHNGGHFKQTDVETIQSLILAELSPEDFKQIAKLSFANWATPARLSGPGLPHLNRVNQCLAQQIATSAKMGVNQTQLTMLDLGAGLLGTTESIVQALAPLSVVLDVIAVESTPELVQIASCKADDLMHRHPNLNLRIHQGDMLDYLHIAPSSAYDFITVSFAIHHLHPLDQSLLVKETRRTLKPLGLLLVADPQEGKSEFNLNVLIYEEPEALFAAFTSPESMYKMMTEAGFNSIEVLMSNNVTYEAYAMCGRVQPNL
jgi:SAM-dependent methyltransferase